MKKLMLLAAVAVFGLSSVNAQNFNAGVSAALPMGDAGDVTTFGVSLDVNYLWEISEDFDAGVASGYQHYFGDSVDILGASFDYEDFGFYLLPLLHVMLYLRISQLELI